MTAVGFIFIPTFFCILNKCCFSFFTLTILDAVEAFFPLKKKKRKHNIEKNHVYYEHMYYFLFL